MQYMKKEQGERSLRNKVVGEVFWSTGQRLCGQVISLVVSFILARLLLPKDYGLASLLLSIMAICHILIDGGYVAALVQKKEATDTDFSTAFWIYAVVAVCLYCIMYFAAPLVARWYGEPSLVPMFRVIFLGLPVAGMNSILRARVMRRMEFRNLFFAALVGSFFSAVVSIYMAYHGYGAWALIFQFLISYSVETVMLWIFARWSPKQGFSKESFRTLTAFSSKVLGVLLLDTVFEQMRILLIGKRYDPEQLAYYSKGKQFPDLIGMNISASISAVLFPVVAKSQEDLPGMQKIVRRAMKTNTYLLSPLLIGMMLIAEPLIRLLLTEKWLFCVPILQIYCAAYLFKPFQDVSVQAIKALGMGRTLIKQEIVKKSYGALILAITLLAFHSIEAVALGYLVSIILDSLVVFVPCGRRLGYSIGELIRDLAPILLLNLCMAGLILLVGMLPLGDAARILSQVAVGGVSYLLLSLLSKNDAFYYLLDTLKEFRSR